jgi:hypothetical protein
MAITGRDKHSQRVILPFDRYRKWHFVVHYHSRLTVYEGTVIDGIVPISGPEAHHVHENPSKLLYFAVVLSD